MTTKISGAWGLAGCVVLAACAGNGGTSPETEVHAQAAVTRLTALKGMVLDRAIITRPPACNPKLDRTCADPKPCDPTVDKTCTAPTACDPTVDKTCEPKPCDPKVDKTCEPKPCDPKVDKTCEPKPCDPKVDRSCTPTCDPKVDKKCGSDQPVTLPGCDRMRVIGTAMGVCPAADGEWSGGSMFGDAKVVPSGGGTFCFYEYKGHPDKYTIKGLPTEPRSRRAPHEWLHSDCSVVVGLEGEDAQKALASMAPAYVKGYQKQMAASRLPSLGPTLPAKVKVAVLDSAPDGDFDPQQPGPDHGRVVGASIKGLTCPNGEGSSCAISLTAARVLGQDTSSDATNTYGYIGDLARQVVKVTQTHLGERLVINLSVGYHPKYSLVDTADDVDMWHEATNALMAAVNYATCNGALVIAAAGNTDHGPMTDPQDYRPMFPASLGEYTTWDCPSSPLLFAASGVMPDDTELPNARPGATASLVAPAFAVGVDMGSDANLALPLKTGSSFAASGVSAVASVVWSYLPFLSPQKIINIVRNTGVSLPALGAPDFCVGQPCGDVRRVSVCNAASTAIAVACNQSSISPYCSGILPLGCQTPPAGTGTMVEPDPALMMELAEQIAASYQPLSNTTCPVNPVWATDPNLAQETLCAEEMYSNAQSRPFTLAPLPGADPCRVCFILRYNNFYTLYAAFQPSYAAGSLSGSTLRSASGTPQALGSALNGAYGANLVAVPLVNNSLSGSSANLSHQVAGEQTSVTSTIPIVMSPWGF